jgi:DNA polymerase III alpha subunit
MYVPLWCKSNFSFLEGASRPDELIEEAHRLGLPAIAITDRDGVYGMVRAYVKARELGVSLIAGATVTVAAPGARLVASPVGSGPLQLRGLHDQDYADDDGPSHHGSSATPPNPSSPLGMPAASGRRGRMQRTRPRQVHVIQPVLPISAALGRSVAVSSNPSWNVPSSLVLLALDRSGWSSLTRLLTIGRRRTDKGTALVSWEALPACSPMMTMQEPW